MNNSKERLAKSKAKSKLITKIIKNKTLKIKSESYNQIVFNFDIKSTSKMEDKIGLNCDTLIQNIQCFEGKKDQDISFFLEQFEELVDAAKIPDPLRIVILKSKLAGSAKQFLINAPELRNEKNYETLKEKLKENFKLDRSFAEAQDKFITAKQAATQKVEDYVRDFNLIAHRYLSSSGHAEKEGAKQLLKTIKLTRFIEGLRPDISFELQKNGPESYEEAVKLAKKIEIAINNSAKLDINNITVSDNSNIYEALVTFSKQQSGQIDMLREEINNLKLQSNNTREIEKKETLYCHICSLANHSTHKCRYNSKNNQDISKFNTQNQANSNQHNYYSRDNKFKPKTGRGGYQNNYSYDKTWNTSQNSRYPNQFNQMQGNQFNSQMPPFGLSYTTPQNFSQYWNPSFQNFTTPPPFYMPSTTTNYPSNIPRFSSNAQITYNPNMSQNAQPQIQNNGQNLN